jgi:hypothetical protein
MISSLNTFDHYIIHVCQNDSSKLRVKDYCYHSRECASCILQSFWHSHETKCAERGAEASFFFIFSAYSYLVIP